MSSQFPQLPDFVESAILQGAIHSELLFWGSLVLAVAMLFRSRGSASKLIWRWGALAMFISGFLSDAPVYEHYFRKICSPQEGYLLLNRHSPALSEADQLQRLRLFALPAQRTERWDGTLKMFASLENGKLQRLSVNLGRSRIAQPLNWASGGWGGKDRCSLIPLEVVATWRQH